MMTLGVTGGIGMGKSKVAEILARRGVAVVDTDELARHVVSPGEPALEEIRSAFGSAVFSSMDELNRSVLADIVFRDPVARTKLEAILHPRIQQRWQKQLVNWHSEGQTRAAVIIPLLFETGAEPEFDVIICIACSAATQQQRLRSRGWTPEQIQQRISAQLPATDKMARAHRVIWNEGDLEILDRQCDRVLSACA